MNSPDDNDPIRSAFTARAGAARQGLDLDSGLASVHCRSKRGQRMARGSAGLGIGAVVLAAGFFGLRGGSDGQEVTTDVPAVDVANQPEAGDELPAPAGDSNADAPVAEAQITVPPTSVATEPAVVDEANESEGPVDGVDYFAIDRALWKVINVAEDDVLFVRSGPNASAEQIGELGPTAADIRNTGSAARLDGGAYWYEIDQPTTSDRAGSDSPGWVNAAFLERQAPQPGTGFTELACAVTPGMLSGDDAAPSAPFFPTSATLPEGVVELVSITGDSGPVGDDSVGSCDRVVITLSSDGLGEVVAYESETGLRLDLPMVESAFQTELAESDVYFVRSADDQGFYVDLLQAPGIVAVTFLENPARIVIDQVSETTRADQSPAPTLAGDGVIVKTVESSTGSESNVALPATVRGYARPFEATLTVEIRDQNGIVVPGPILTGDEVYGTGPEFGVGTSDWVLAWGEFEFTIDGLAPGSYVLALAPSWDEQTDEYNWQELPFTVG